MAAVVSAPNSPFHSPALVSPPLKALKKALSGRRRSSEIAQSDTNLDLSHHEFINSEGGKSSRRLSTNSSPGRDSARSSRNSISNFVARHSRKKKKFLDEEIESIEDDFPRGRGLGLSTSPSRTPKPPVDVQENDGESSLLTDDSEIETPPPLISRESHHGYLTTSSPAVNASFISGDDKFTRSQQVNMSTGSIPKLDHPTNKESSPSPKSPPQDNTATVPSLSTLSGPTLLRPDTEGEDMARRRSKSPARKFRDVFKSGKSPRPSPKTSPERQAVDVNLTPRPSDFTSASNSNDTKPAERSGTIVYNPKGKENTAPTLPPRAATLHTPPQLPPRAAMLQTTSRTDGRPMTPPSAIVTTPLTTVTPPTPTEKQHEFPSNEERTPKQTKNRQSDSPTTATAPTGNNITHRRVRSTPGIPLPPSRLSTTTQAPLTPTDEVRTPSSGTVVNRNVSGSFFSSWMTVAQNAATTITNLTAQNRSRSGTNTSESSRPKQFSEPIQEESETVESDTPRKIPAVETLGSGNLNFEHLGLDADRLNGASGPGPAEKGDALARRDEVSARVEDMLAKRAVSAAYEGLISGTPVAELPDPMPTLRQMPSSAATSGGETTPPNGSIIDEPGALNRSSSVRSKVAAKRRSRGSSTATGQSALGALVGGSTAALVNPVAASRSGGYTIAPKARNRTFHQQFRSVPEDDNLIEDYSCALQREILLAGRIYISEGHICFSSNILGWVTNLVISFEEIVSVEKENTALVIPNAIAIQTLHQRHIFRSLLSREATYDLMIAIWRVSHPASFQKSINGKQMAADEAAASLAAASAAANNAANSSASSDEGSGSDDDDDFDEDEDDDSDGSLIGSGSPASSDKAGESKAVMTRKASNMSGTTPQDSKLMLTDVLNAPQANSANPPATGDVAVDFPGPQTHSPTECTDSATHYDKIVKDEVIAAPLGKIYSLLFGPQSGAFVTKFLVDECKCTELVLEDDKKGLNTDIKSRQYNYIKPLGGSIGPKQTKCITTENLDFFDLEKSVTVTCTTQTPDVPSGNAFSVKTRYCLTWAPGNATRFQMNCGIEWTAKSWLKGPIEKGANDGQQSYGDSIVRILKSTVGGRARGATSSSNKVTKNGKKKRKGEKKSSDTKVEEKQKVKIDWGMFEPIRGPLEPVVNILRPILRTEAILGFGLLLIFYLWFQRPSRSHSLSSYPYGTSPSPWSRSERMLAYEELWHQEESELWSWLEARAGIDTIAMKQTSSQSREKSDTEREKNQSKQRQKLLKSKDVEARLREEKMTEREMSEAIRITKERLEILEGVLHAKRASHPH